MCGNSEEIAEIEAELVEITAAISALRLGGQSFTISSGASSRAVTMVDYSVLVQNKRDLELRLRELRGTVGIVIRAGW